MDMRVRTVASVAPQERSHVSYSVVRESMQSTRSSLRWRVERGGGMVLGVARQATRLNRGMLVSMATSAYRDVTEPPPSGLGAPARPVSSHCALVPVSIAHWST